MSCVPRHSGELAHNLTILFVYSPAVEVFCLKSMRVQNKMHSFNKKKKKNDFIFSACRVYCTALYIYTQKLKKKKTPISYYVLLTLTHITCRYNIIVIRRWITFVLKMYVIIINYDFFFTAATAAATNSTRPCPNNSGGRSYVCKSRISVFYCFSKHIRHTIDPRCDRSFLTFFFFLCGLFNKRFVDLVARHLRN